MEEFFLPGLTHYQFLKINNDYKKAASAINLAYISDKENGILRIRKGNHFLYVYNNKAIREKDMLERIKKLAIPPAWEEVWICPLKNGHIQATGLDARKRKQYRYHTLWNLLRNETKFHRLREFGKVLPQLRLAMEKDMATKEMTAQKVIATVLSLMERTYIRIGNNEYEKLYGSYGLTTMQDKHTKIENDKITFSFKGKKGIYHSISLQNKKLAKIVKDCRDIPGKELFQYYDEQGNKKSIDSGMVNQYIKDATGHDFSAKDFRTWAGSLQALQYFHSLDSANTPAEIKKNIASVLEAVSNKLGNTKNVCKKYYVHPGLIKMYEENKLNKYLKQLDSIEKNDTKTGLTPEEQILMKILKP